MSEVPARTRIAASTGPMHGAAQIANAPPSNTRDPRLRAPCTRPAPTRRSGQGRRPMNASPKTTSTKPAIRWSRNWSRKKLGSDQLGADAERDEDGSEAEYERDAGEHHAPGRATVAEPICLHCRDSRQVPRHEGQHARREERDESRKEGDEGLGRPHPASTPRSGRAPRPPAARGRGRARSASVSTLPSRRRLHVHARAPTTTTPIARAPSGRSQARRSNPRFGGSASTAGPNWSTSCALISAALSPAAIRSRMYVFIRVGDG